MSTLINKADYGCWRKENSFMQSLPSSTPWKLISSIILPSFEGFEGDVFFRPFPHANLIGRGSTATATIKMELFDQVTLCLGILKKKTIVLVAEARARIQANV